MTRRHRTSRTAAAALAAVLLSAACSSSEDVAAPPAAPSAGAPSAQPPAAASAPGATLRATVGTEDDPEAYEIALTTADGEPVEELPAGSYRIEVVDYSRTHNFALRGPGVDEATSVPQVEQAVFEVTLQAGEYTYVCDPHPSMTGTVAVT